MKFVVEDIKREVTATYVSKRILEEEQHRICSMATVESSSKFTVMIDSSGSSYQGNPFFMYHRSTGFNNKTPVIGFSIERPEVVIPFPKRLLQISRYDLEVITEWLSNRTRRYFKETNWKAILYEWNRECQNLSYKPVSNGLYEDQMEAFFDGYYDEHPEDVLSVEKRFVPSNLPQPDYLSIKSEYMGR